MAFVFYDTETTGIDTTFDQVLQFAAIRTDDDLNELERFEIRCRLLPHIVPSPGALIATRVSPAQLTDPELPSHYQAMCAIAQKLRDWSPAIIVGYNTIAFDEPLLRQSFYQTLQPVYLTNTHGNRRADVLRLAQATATLRPNAISIPINEKNKPTLKLDRLAPANGFAHDNAHDALADVEATIFMAQRIRNRAPDVWSSLMPLVDKHAVEELAFGGAPVCLVEYHMSKASIMPVAGVAQNPDNPTMLGLFDLAKDPNPIMELDVDGLVKAMQGPDRAIRLAYSNKFPILTDLALAPSLSVTSPDVAAERAAMVTGNVAFRERMREALRLRYPPREHSQIVEQRMYEGFPNRADQARMLEFHSAPWPNRKAIVGAFEDPRFRELGQRLLYIESPDQLDPTRQAQWDAWLSNRLQGREGVEAGRTLEDARIDLKKLEKDGRAQAGQLSAIRHWLETRITSNF